MGYIISLAFYQPMERQKVSFICFLCGNHKLPHKLCFSSSTVSQDSGGQADPQKSKKHQKPSTTAEQDNSKKTTITDSDTDAVKQDEEDDEEEESRSQEITPSHTGSDKTCGIEDNQNSREEEDTDETSCELIAEEKRSDRKGVDKGDVEKVEGTDDKEEVELDDGEGSEGNREETEHSDGEEKDGEDIPDIIPDSDSKEGADRQEREIEKNHSHNELVKEEGTQGGTLKREDKTESGDNIDISERNIQITNNRYMCCILIPFTYTHLIHLQLYVYWYEVSAQWTKNVFVSVLMSCMVMMTLKRKGITIKK